MEVKMDDWATLNSGEVTVINNPWGALQGGLDRGTWRQSVSETGGKLGWRSTFLDNFDPSKILAYPQVFIGRKDHNLASNTDSFPLRVGEIDSLKITMGYSYSGNATKNVAFETFFHNSDHIDQREGSDTREVEMMVWLEAPRDTQIRFGLFVGTESIGGVSWDVFIKVGDSKYIAFIATTDQSGCQDLDWMGFINTQRKVAAETGTLTPIRDDHRIGALEFGTEIWGGDIAFIVEKFEYDLVRSNAAEKDTSMAAQAFYADLAHQHLLISERHKDIYNILKKQAGTH